MSHLDHGTQDSHDAGPSKKKDGCDNMASDERRHAYLTPSRWWFASTVFPLIAGTFGPVATAFSICALAVRWSTPVPSEDDDMLGVMAGDPPWLNATNAPQLAIALVANSVLLLQMARKVRFSIALPIIIVGWYISSFSLIALVATMSHPFESLAPNQNLGQAFYYAVLSAGLYFLVASLMVVTFIGASKKRYDRKFNLTTSQRTMMVQTIIFLVYLLGGSAVFAHIEGWEYLDAVYWADCTLLTIGLGDFSPATTLGRSLLFPYAIGGIVILGLLVSSIRSQVLERGNIKIGARMTEKEREHVLEKARKNSTLLMPVLERFSTVSPGVAEMLDGPRPLTEIERRRLEFELMRKVQKHATFKRQWITLLISTSTFLGLWLGGAAVFQAVETSQNWSYFESAYFSYTSLLTIGYGDIHPTSNIGKPFFVFWSLLAIPALTIMISNMAETVIKSIRDLTLFDIVILSNGKGRASLKQIIHKNNVEKVISNGETPQSPNIPSGAFHSDETSGSNIDNYYENESTIIADQALDFNKISYVQGAKDERSKHFDKAALKARNYRHYMLVKQIRKIVGYLADGSLRKYTYDEWVDYLNLIGEDESSPETHRRARRWSSMRDQSGRPTEAVSKDMEKNEADPKWSWVGYRSPLMGNNETEWLLERLTGTLEREIKELIREESQDGHT